MESIAMSEAWDATKDEGGDAAAAAKKKKSLPEGVESSNSGGGGGGGGDTEKAFKKARAVMDSLAVADAATERAKVGRCKLTLA